MDFWSSTAEEGAVVLGHGEPLCPARGAATAVDNRRARSNGPKLGASSHPHSPRTPGDGEGEDSDGGGDDVGGAPGGGGNGGGGRASGGGARDRAQRDVGARREALIARARVLEAAALKQHGRVGHGGVVETLPGWIAALVDAALGSRTNAERTHWRGALKVLVSPQLLGVGVERAGRARGLAGALRGARPAVARHPRARAAQGCTAAPRAGGHGPRQRRRGGGRGAARERRPGPSRLPGAGDRVPAVREEVPAIQPPDRRGARPPASERPLGARQRGRRSSASHAACLARGGSVRMPAPPPPPPPPRPPPPPPPPRGVAHAARQPQLRGARGRAAAGRRGAVPRGRGAAAQAAAALRAALHRGLQAAQHALHGLRGRAAAGGASRRPRCGEFAGLGAPGLGLAGAQREGRSAAGLRLAPAVG
jgi:hypothetical protein